MASNKAKIPPQNTEAEQSVLGSLLIDKDAIVRVAEFLKPEHFYKEQHAVIYSAILALYEKRQPADLVTVTDELKRVDKYDFAGGTGYLTTLVNSVPTSAHIEHYANLVKDKATKRNLISAAAKITEEAFEEEKEVKDLLDIAEQTLFGISQEHLKQNFVPIRDILAVNFERIEELHKKKGKMRGVPTGFADLDKKLSGLQESNLIVLAARPSLGKSTLSINIAHYVGTKEKMPVGVFSLEMSKEQLIDLMLASEADVDAWKITTGNLEDEDFDKLSEAMGELSEAPIFIDDTPGISLSEMRTKARRLQMEHGLSLLIVDYLQLVRGRNLENRVQEVSEISQALKNIARELHIPVIAISQLSRAVESRQTRVPQLADLRESGCLAGDTLLMRADTGRLVTIKELVGKDDIPIFSLTNDLKLEISKISKVFSSGRKQLFELKTKSGRLIKASSNHPFFTIEGWRRVDELRMGDRVGIPSSLPFNSQAGALSEDELILLAHLLGDGCVLPRQPIHYTSADQANIRIVSTVANKLFNIVPRIVKQQNWWHVYLPSPYRLTRGKHHPIIQWYKKLRLNPVRSYEKELPKELFESSAEKIRLFLHHLWATDGNISWKKLPGRIPAGVIYYSTTSLILANQIQHLLLRSGILSVLRPRFEKKGRTSYQIHIQGKEMQIKFCRLIGSFGSRGKMINQLLQSLELIDSNPNLDVIPSQVWKTLVCSEKEKIDASWRDVSAMIGTAYCGSTLFKSGLSRARMGRLASGLRSPALFNLANSDIYWDEIVSITPLGIEEVFDATVPGTHNFVANDFIVHNSIEQDADVVMFLYREDPDNLEDVKLLIAKHRSGPLGEVDLKFKGERRKFYAVEKGRMG